MLIAIREIAILETIKEGNTIYRKRTIDKLNGYFVKNTVKFDDNYDFKHIVVNNKKGYIRNSQRMIITPSLAV